MATKNNCGANRRTTLMVAGNLIAGYLAGQRVITEGQGTPIPVLATEWADELLTWLEKGESDE